MSLSLVTAEELQAAREEARGATEALVERVSNAESMRDPLQGAQKALNALERRVAGLLQSLAPRIPTFSFWNFPADVGAPKLTSTTETMAGLTFTTATCTVPQFEDQKFARPDRMALDLVTLGKGSVDFMLYAWSAEQGVNAAQFSATPTLALIKTVTMATDIANHRYHKYFSLTQSEIDALMAIPTKYGLVFGLRYKAQPASEMSSLMVSVQTAYKGAE